MPRIHTVTLNPAIDRILYLEKFVPEITNRLSKTADGLGGKGTHVSINLSLLGIDNQAMGIVHGEIGQRIIQLLEEQNVQVCFQHFPEQNSRTNYLLIEDSGKSTCLSSKGVQLSEQDIDSFLLFMEKHIEEGDYLVLSGDASNCPDPFVYNKIMQAFRDKKLKVFLDASGETLKSCIREKPYMIKPNQDELSYLCGRSLNSQEDIIAAVDELAACEIPVIAVSLGGEGSIVRSSEGTFRNTVPKVQVCNTIGCGDCFLSGLIYGIYKGLPVEETLKIATAISAATAEEKTSVGFDADRAKELFSQVTVTKLKG